MAYDKRISKQERRQIRSARREYNTGNYRESQKYLNAVKHHSQTLPTLI